MSAAGRSAAQRVPGRAGPIWSRRVGWFLAHVVWRTTVVGAEHLPRTGPVLIAANHVAAIDGPVLHGALPRGTHILVKREVFHGVVGLILRAAGQIAVDRSSGRAGLEAALGVLRRGGAVGIFPEGGRGQGAVSGVRAGVAWLAVHGAAPVVPVAILGTRRSGEGLSHLPELGRRFVVEIGQPVRVDLPEGLARRDAVTRTAEVVAAALAAHVRAAAATHGVALPTDGPELGAASDAAASA